ncbi:MAG: hypothetical protein LWY06_18380 [Firmicutes bacterium]|nr:hypothetical protein [Bacillota bacterium]
MDNNFETPEMELENDKLQRTLDEEQMLKDVLKRRFAALGSYSPNDAEILAYRLAEIVVCSKNLYLHDFNELVEKHDGDEQETWNSVMGMRMNLLHIKDCIEEFDIMLLELMEGKDEEDEDEEGESDDEADISGN